MAVCQSGLDGEIAHQLAIDAIKLLPTLRVIARFEPVQQAWAGLNGGSIAAVHTRHAIQLNAARRGSLQTISSQRGTPGKSGPRPEAANNTREPLACR